MRWLSVAVVGVSFLPSLAFAQMTDNQLLQGIYDRIGPNTNGTTNALLLNESKRIGGALYGIGRVETLLWAVLLLLVVLVILEGSRRVE